MAATDMGLNCHNATIKYLLFVANFAFAVCGFAGLALCASMLSTEAKSVAGIDWSLGILTAISFITFFVSFMGLFGAIRENTVLLVAYAGSLAVIIAAQVIACGVLISRSDLAEQSIEKIFLFAKMGDIPNGYVVSSIQGHFRCCGYNNPSFWYRSNGSEFLPTSCCDGALVDTCTRTDPRAYTEGCRAVFVSFLRKYGISMGIVGIAIAMLQLLGIWFSLALAARIRDLQRRMKGL